MAKYMITWDIPSANRNEAFARFMEGSAMQPPDSVNVLTRWHGAGTNMGWSVVETDDPKSIADWLLSWNNLITYDLTPVLADEEIGEIASKHGLG